jgi:hypothetical protein
MKEKVHLEKTEQLTVAVGSRSVQSQCTVQLVTQSSPAE